MKTRQAEIQSSGIEKLEGDVKSAIAVNKLLIEKGFQTKNEGRKSRKEPNYLPTTRGSEWAAQTTSKGKSGDNTTYFQLRWYPSVLEVLG